MVPVTGEPTPWGYYAARHVLETGDYIVAVTITAILTGIGYAYLHWSKLDQCNYTIKSIPGVQLQDLIGYINRSTNNCEQLPCSS